MLKDFFGKKVKVINLGIASFADDLRKQGVETIHTDWRPPAGGNKKIQALLAKVANWQSRAKSSKGAR